MKKTTRKLLSLAMASAMAASPSGERNQLLH